MSTSESDLLERPSHLLAAAIEAARRGDLSGASRLVWQVEQRPASHQPSGAEKKLIAAIRSRFKLIEPSLAVAEPSVPTRMGSGPVEVLDGVSLVTCCMNRTENLLKALPTWLALQRISEIIVVDWSSATPVAQALQEAGLLQPGRVRVIRVTDEPHWILSFAFNVGFRNARYKEILKVDADITLRPDFFERNLLTPGMFIAGDWEKAEKGQEHINGFFYVTQADLLRVKGFNEYITTYGWDDDDIYFRLAGSGLRRVCVDTQSIYHIPHDDSQRLGNAGGEAVDTARTQLERNTLFKIRANRFIATIAPSWNQDRQFAPFELTSGSHGQIMARRLVQEMPHYLSADIRRDAEYFAALELVSWRVGPQVYHLPRAAFNHLLDIKSLEQISAFDVLLGIEGGQRFASLRRHSLLIELVGPVAEAALVTLQRVISEQLDFSQVSMFVCGGSAAQREAVKTALEGQGVVLDTGGAESGLATIEPHSVHELGSSVHKGSGAVLKLDASMQEILLQPAAGAMAAPQAPSALIVRRPRLYIDTQHGLGNRLRAYASAAAVAKQTDRELVLLWTPDHHCECRFTDLFDSQVALIGSPEEVPGGTRRYNYMEIEQGACKGELIELAGAGDVLVRSAYVLNHPASKWEDENRTLRALKPSRDVLEKVEAVNVEGCIGVHVRMEAGKGLDHHSYDSVANWSQKSHDEIHYWRSKSHYSAFIKRMDQLIEENGRRQFFLATDLQENYDVFVKQYGSRIRYLPRQTYDRSREQIVYALADALLLSRCDRLLGSTWSSFTELATRMSTRFSKVEMSGTDF